jgi:hypothetical protein
MFFTARSLQMLQRLFAIARGLKFVDALHCLEGFSKQIDIRLTIVNQ